MLKEIKLNNYRGFQEHTIPIREFTIAVGENNAGKSTLVEALRLLSIVTARYKNLPFRRPPSWANLPLRYRGVSPSLRSTEVQFQTLYHHYAEPPAVVTAVFDSSVTITMYLGGDEELFAVIRDATGQVIGTRASAKGLQLPVVSTMPQVAPLAAEEQILTEEYVRGALFSPLAPRHFRNQLHLFRAFFQEFKSVAEDSWSGLQIRSLDVEGSMSDRRIYLQVRNEDFVGEVGLMGHGLQMWLQTIWFLTRARGSQTVILDEPDVYMHPDLQRKLVRFLRTRFQQIVLTTHSVEIMSEVQPQNVLIVDRKKQQSIFAGDLEAVQRLLSGIGSAHNVHLARLWAARRLLLVEGKDLAVLKRVHDLYFPEAESLQSVPNMEIGGWAGWQYAVGSSMAFRNAMGQEVTTYCILDPDFRTPATIARRLEDARGRDVQLHIWNKKEIENYLLLPCVIARVIQQRLDGERTPRRQAPSEEDIWQKIVELADTLEDETLDKLSNEFSQEDRAAQEQSNSKARARLRKCRGEQVNIVSLVSGKKLFAMLSDWTSGSYGVSFGTRAILNNLQKTEVPEEIGRVVTAIEKGWPFQP